MRRLVWPAASLGAAMCCGVVLGGAVSADPLVAKAQSLFKPLPSVSSTEPPADRVELGRLLFHDPRLSASETISCASCHSLATWGVDNRPVSPGHRAQTGTRNSPTVLNAFLNERQFWDGRAGDLVEQAKGPILNPVEMAMDNETLAVGRIARIPGYAMAFRRAFPGAEPPVTFDNIARAIADFEKVLATPARFDRFLEGDASALSQPERRGLQRFMSAGCAGCHAGVGVGGTGFQKFGISRPYAFEKDLGRYLVTKRDEDRFVFKVPTLRNVTRTHPYFHDGGIGTLEEAVTVMGQTQLGRSMPKAETADITAFLGTLQGEVPEKYRAIPVLPPSGPDAAIPAPGTPRP